MAKTEVVCKECLIMQVQVIQAECTDHVEVLEPL